MEYKIVDIGLLKEGYNPRRYFDEETMKKLRESIEELGILMPLLVRSVDGYYEIIGGTRRYRVAKELNISEIEVKVKELTDEQAAHLAYIDNKERDDYDPMSEAGHFQYMKEKYDWSTRDMERKGYGAQSAVVFKLRLLSLPEEVQKLLITQVIKEKHCRFIAQLYKSDDLRKLFEVNALYIPNWEEELQKEIEYRQNLQIQLANNIIENELSARTTENKVKALKIELEARDKNIEEIIKKEREKQSLLEGICFKDARDMSELSEESIHLIITSPPYFAGKEWDKEKTFNNYKGLLKDVLKECARVLVKEGKLCINVGDIPNINKGKDKMPIRIYPIIYLLEPILRKYKIYLKDKIIWVKDDPWVSNPHIKFEDQEGRYRILPSTEYIYVFEKEGKRKEIPPSIKLGSGITKEEWTEWVSGAWHIPSVRKNDDHPAKFPEELPYRLIKMYSFKRDNVLDPFLGSGTTAKAAMKLGRNKFGYEINEEYKDVIIKNLSREGDSKE